MKGRKADVTMTINPDSGTGALTGVSGRFKSTNDAGTYSRVREDEFQ